MRRREPRKRIDASAEPESGPEGPGLVHAMPRKQRSGACSTEDQRAMISSSTSRAAAILPANSESFSAISTIRVARRLNEDI